MGLNYLWDTNTVIYYLQKQFPKSGEAFIDKILLDSPPCISAITEIELLCWKTEDEKDMIILNNFIQDSLIIELEQPIKAKTAEIRKKNNIKLPDAIIAATALTYNLILISRNTSDFSKITDIEIIDPFTLEPL